MNGTTKYTVWHYLGCGCAVLLLLAALAIGGMVWFGWRTAESMRETIENPEVREAELRELLGYDELPEGYHPGFVLHIPWIMDLAAIGDREMPAREGMSVDTDDVVENRGFFFFRMRAWGSREEMSSDADLDFAPHETVREGEIEAGGARVAYVAQRGTSETDGGSFPSLAAEMDIFCDDRYHRFGIWFERFTDPDAPVDAGAGEGGEVVDTEAADGEIVEAEPPTPGEPIAAEPPDYTGTPADEEALRTFLDHFELCRS